MSNVEPLAQAWLAAKQAEAVANAKRLKIEAELCAALEVPQEGSKTQTIGSYKITVTQPVSRKLDEAKWEKVKAKIPATLWPVKVKLEADALGCKYLADKEPALWRKIAGAFTTKPGKPGFAIVEVPNGN